MKKTYYIKEGRKYVPVAEYDSELMDSYPYGSHLVVNKRGSGMRRFCINPDFPALLAAASIMEDTLSHLLYKAGEARPHKEPLTKQQIAAWNKMKKVMGEELFMLQYKSCREIAEELLKEIQKEAEGASANPLVEDARNAYITAILLTTKVDNEIR